VVILEYVGPGYQTGIPARDLVEADVAALPPEWPAERLVAEGPYRAAPGVTLPPYSPPKGRASRSSRSGRGTPAPAEAAANAS